MKVRFALVALCAALTACGGGGSGSPTLAPAANQPFTQGPSSESTTVQTTPPEAPPPAQAKPEVPAPFSAQFSVYDDFQRPDTLSGDIGTPTTGKAWKLLGSYDGTFFPPSAIGRISSGLFVVDAPATVGHQADYALQELQGTASRVGAQFQFVNNTGINQGTNTFTLAILIAPQDRAITNMVHFTLTPWAWDIELWSPDGSRRSLAYGYLPAPLENGKAYSVNLDLTGEKITLTLPGLTKTVTDPAIPSHKGKFVSWEHYAAGPTSNLLQYKAVWATEAETLPALTLP